MTKKGYSYKKQFVKEKTLYGGMLICPKCQEKGALYLRLRLNTRTGLVTYEFRIYHPHSSFLKYLCPVDKYKHYFTGDWDTLVEKVREDLKALRPSFK